MFCKRAPLPYAAKRKICRCRRCQLRGLLAAHCETKYYCSRSFVRLIAPEKCFLQFSVSTPSRRLHVVAFFSSLSAVGFWVTVSQRRETSLIKCSEKFFSPSLSVQINLGALIPFDKGQLIRRSIK